MSGLQREDSLADKSIDAMIFGADNPPPRAEESTTGEALVFAYTGRGRNIVGLTIVNALLNIVTLTLYRFWGRTNVRRHILSRTTINGEPMEYTGTGWELFKGFLIVVFGVMLPLFLAVLAIQFFAPQLFTLVFSLFYLLMFFLVNFAIYAARRYRFSRSSWRGIRFSMDGSATNYSWAAIGYGILTSFTLGWYGPAAHMRLQRRMWDETLFGATRFKIRLPDSGLAGPTYGAFALTWFGGIVIYFLGAYALLVLGRAGVFDPSAPTDTATPLSIYGVALGVVLLIALISIPYQAALMKRTAELVGIDRARFELDVRSASLLWLYFSNAVILILTLGLGEPIASARTFRYVFNRLSSKGLVDIDAIKQAKSRGPGMGEGLADAFDVGGF